MDRAALIHKLRTEVDCGPCSLIRDVASALEADRTEIARLKKIEARIRCATAALETIDEREGMKWEVARDILAHLDHILEGSNDG